jgi:hypothetical protein
MYDYYLGGVHNFPADQNAARAIIEQYPFVQATARANRAFVVRAVRHLAQSGIRQFLDIGAGLPAVDSIHSIARKINADTRVVYVDIDPTAVADALEMLEGDERALAIRGDVRDAAGILGHRDVRRMLDFDQPVGLLLAAVLHFVPDHAEGNAAVATFTAALAPGSALVVSHSATESFLFSDAQEDVYRQRTATPGTLRSRSQIEQLFSGLELLEPGVVWAQEWRPDPDAPDHDATQPGGFWAGVATKP